MAWKKLGRIYNPEKTEHVLGGVRRESSCTAPCWEQYSKNLF